MLVYIIKFKTILTKKLFLIQNIHIKLPANKISFLQIVLLYNQVIFIHFRLKNKFLFYVKILLCHLPLKLKK